MVSIPGVTFIFASLDGRLDLSDNFDLPYSFSRFIQRYNVERAIPHRGAVFVTEPVSVYIPNHFWRIRIFRISSFLPRRCRLRFVCEKKNCSVSIDTLQLIMRNRMSGHRMEYSLRNMMMTGHRSARKTSLCAESCGRLRVISLTISCSLLNFLYNHIII